jgi:hypothetical protein
MAMRYLLGFCLTVSLCAGEVTVTEKSFGCLLELPKVRNTRIQHPDPEKLKEAIRIFSDSVPDKEYPVGTILQLVPFEAMVKHEKADFPNTNGWEFFFLGVSDQGTKILDRGEKAMNTRAKSTCLECHQAGSKFDYVCEKGHGCAPVPLTDQKIAEIQASDPRCSKK